MKDTLNTLFMIKYCLLLWGLGVMSILQAQSNRALVITIGEYPRRNGWEKIHADNDAGLVSEMLLKHQYTLRNTTFLSNAEATKSGVDRALSELLRSICPGDYIYLHFSCHGQQMMDDNGDEEDGLDESIVLYDASFWYVPGKYEGENHLRDDELGEWINKMRTKTGKTGCITVLIDACHSGTANRNNGEEEYVRGTAAIFAPPGYVPQPGKHQNLSLRLKEEDGLAPAIVFSACLPDELNYEYYDKERKQFFGTLTYAFQALVNRSKKVTLPSDFAKALREKVYESIPYRKNRTQTPYMECSNEKSNFRINH